MSVAEMVREFMDKYDQLRAKLDEARWLLETAECDCGADRPFTERDHDYRCLKLTVPPFLAKLQVVSRQSADKHFDDRTMADSLRLILGRLEWIVPNRGDHRKNLEEAREMLRKHIRELQEPK